MRPRWRRLEVALALETKRAHMEMKQLNKRNTVAKNAKALGHGFGHKGRWKAET